MAIYFYFEFSEWEYKGWGGPINHITELASYRGGAQVWISVVHFIELGKLDLLPLDEACCQFNRLLS